MRKIFEKIDAYLEKEKGTIKKEHGGKIKICLIYPNTYSVGISNLGFQTVYRLFNKRRDTVCERCFLPQIDELKDYESGYPLFSFESKKPIYEFDILAFSLCFENDYPNIMKIFELSKIPALTKERDYRYPLVVAGGVVCFTNPEPIADLFDVIFVGEAEELIDTFIDIYLEVKKNSYEEEIKRNLKEELLEVEGFYIPEAYKEIYDVKGRIKERQILWHNAPAKIKKVYCRDLSEKISYSQVISPHSVFSDMFLLETMRGCPFSCRFCLVGQVYNPPRKVFLEKLSMKIDEISKNKYTVGLIAPSLTAYGDLNKLIKEKDVELSFTSIRADKATQEVLDLLGRRKTLTIAPEAGSERLRKVIKKGITESDLLSLAEKLSYTELENLKLYFMIGLPFETDDDIDEIVKLIYKIRHVFHRRLTASVSIFVPKPFTPFQWHKMETENVVKERLKKLKRDLEKIKGVRVLHEVPKYSYLQGYLARADRRGLTVIEKIFKGENFARLIDQFKNELYEPRSFNDFLPWDFIVHEGVSKERLWEEYEKAKREASQTDSI